MSSTTMIAVVGIVALIIGAAGGYFVRGSEVSKLKSDLGDAQMDLSEVTSEFVTYKSYISTPPPSPVTLKASETGLVIIDLQEAWCDPEIAKQRDQEWMYDPQILPVLEKVQELLATARSLGMPIIYVRWADSPGDYHPFWEGVAPQEGELKIYKIAPGAFTGPLTASAVANFTEYMKDYPDVKQFIFTGTVVNWCVLNTASDFRWLNGWAGYNIIYPVDAIGGNAFLNSPTTSNPVTDYAYWWLWFADGGGGFAPQSSTKLTKVDMITFE